MILLKVLLFLDKFVIFISRLDTLSNRLKKKIYGISKKKITFMMNNIILNSSYIGLFIMAKDFSGNKNKIFLLSPKKPICSLLLKKRLFSVFRDWGTILFPSCLKLFLYKQYIQLLFKDQFKKINRKIYILRECCLPWCRVCFSMKIILFLYFPPKVVGMPPVNIHT